MDYLSLSPYDFDQTEKGWRKLDNDDKHLEAAELILRYIEKNRHKITEKVPSAQLLYFHAGQTYAFAGDKYYQQAIGCFNRSYMNSTRWYWYVKGTIAFLQKDKKTLSKSIHNDGMNLEILQRFLEALKHDDNSYKANYQGPVG